MPSNFLYIWGWFWELAARRPSNATGGPQPLTYAELDAWDRILRIGLRSEEVTILMQMDTVYTSTSTSEHQAAVEKAKAKDAPKPKQRFNS